ncbi:hypothetical protein BDV28DRAFT_164343 [Aspergillus coremiiformis]|uniref:Protein kinase domain-containing protein n=1 Tax=Aspergillus coremiiformis TaxID=138285 RepID=A0A5N6YUD1_9EURO|nr:hypothetical protein BDV28DRAFT_164343 [Aspergillus coremiiformis]
MNLTCNNTITFHQHLQGDHLSSSMLYPLPDGKNSDSTTCILGSLEAIKTFQPSQRPHHKIQPARSIMAVKDSLLSLDMGLKDCLYRIRRAHGRVVYVTVKDLDIIPEELRTHGPSVISELSKLSEWDDNTWETLTVSKDESGIRTKCDSFKPHALQEQEIPGTYERINIFDLEILQEFKNRVFRVQRGEVQYFLKIARFGFELAWLVQEIKVYDLLTQYNSALAPRIVGYVFEEMPDRVIGFIVEEIHGSRPNTLHFEACQVALQELHDLDILHGDINRDNLFITDEGVKFIDFEDSCIMNSAENKEEWDKKKSDEMQSLMEKLADDSGRGRPLTVGDDV